MYYVKCVCVKCFDSLRWCVYVKCVWLNVVICVRQWVRTVIFKLLMITVISNWYYFLLVCTVNAYDSKWLSKMSTCFLWYHCVYVECVLFNLAVTLCCGNIITLSTLTVIKLLSVIIYVKFWQWSFIDITVCTSNVYVLNVLTLCYVVCTSNAYNSTLSYVYVNDYG